MALIVSDDEGNEIVEQTEYENEAEMQEYIENNPEAIPLYQINDELEISIAVREFSVESGFLDGLAFDQNGGVYILETKLDSNTTKREVIAQAFDYGASIWDNQHPPTPPVSSKKHRPKQ
jgi:RecB family endonuclease NucS